MTADQTDPRPIFAWSTAADSGIAKYLVRIGGGDSFDAATIAVPDVAGEYQIPLQAPREHIPIYVDAYDNDGNTTEAATTFTIRRL